MMTKRVREHFRVEQQKGSTDEIILKALSTYLLPLICFSVRHMVTVIVVDE